MYRGRKSTRRLQRSSWRRRQESKATGRLRLRTSRSLVSRQRMTWQNQSQRARSPIKVKAVKTVVCTGAAKAWFQAKHEEDVRRGRNPGKPQGTARTSEANDVTWQQG